MGRTRVLLGWLPRRRYRVVSEYLWLGGYGVPLVARSRGGRRFWTLRAAKRWAGFYDRTAWQHSGSLVISSVETLY